MVTTDDYISSVPSGIGCKERSLHERNATPQDSRLEDSVDAVPIHESAFGEITVNDDLRDLTERAMMISSLPSMPIKVGGDQDMNEEL